MSFSDELSSCEKYDKSKLILYVDLECNGLRDVWKFIVELRGSLFTEVHGNFEIHGRFWYIRGLTRKDISGKVIPNLIILK